MKTFKLTDSQALTALLGLSVARGALKECDGEFREVQEALRQQWNRQEAASSDDMIREERLSRRPKRVRPIFQRVLASTNSAEHYLVSRTPSGDWSCTCPDHFYRDRENGCKHIRQVRNQMGV